MNGRVGEHRCEGIQGTRQVDIEDNRDVSFESADDRCGNVWRRGSRGMRISRLRRTREINSQAEDEAGVPRKLGRGGSEGLGTVGGIAAGKI